MGLAIVSIAVELADIMKCNLYSNNVNFMEQDKKSFWDHGVGKFLRTLFVLAIVYVPAYFAGEAWGGKGLIGCILAEFVLLIVVLLIIKKVTNKKV